MIIPHEDKLLLEYVTDEDFYFYPVGKVEPFETVAQACVREIQEELGLKFEFEKILYIRDYFWTEKEEHNLELYILGKVDKIQTDKNPDDPDPHDNHEFRWLGIAELPENLYPKELTKKLVEDFKKGFPGQGEYLGAME